ncbi:MAG: hypothetical protein HY316_08910 [Acidobacteria bacterium]|nr:hypothetical protein [Acidobacteriota bacterium]
MADNENGEKQPERPEEFPVREDLEKRIHGDDEPRREDKDEWPGPRHEKEE